MIVKTENLTNNNLPTITRMYLSNGLAHFLTNLLVHYWILYQNLHIAYTNPNQIIVQGCKRSTMNSGHGQC